jgi:hypothetical protein
VAVAGSAIGVPVATLEATSVLFGNVRAGKTGVASVKLTNTGTDMLMFSLGVTNHSTFGFLSPALADQCGFTSTGYTLPVGQSCRIYLTLAPSTAGSYSALLSVTGGSASATATLDGTAVEPRASVSPPALAFGTVSVGQSSATQTTTLTSTGSMEALILDYARILGPHPADFVIEQGPGCSPKPAKYGPGATLELNSVCTTWVRFQPSAARQRTAKLVHGLDAAGGPHEVVLSGTGWTPPPPSTAADRDPTTWDFGSQPVGSAAKLDVTLTNVDTGSINVKAVTLGYTSGSQGMTVLSDGCGGATLTAGRQCVVTVVFEPDDVSYRSAVLDVAHTAASGPRSVDLSGKGT